MNSAATQPPTPKPAYSLAGNIAFVLRTVWKWTPITIWLSLIGALSQTLMPFIAILLPKIIIDGLSDGTLSIETLLTTIGWATLATLLTTVGAKVSDTLISHGAIRNRTSYMVLCEEKTITMDYAHYEDPAGQTARMKAFEALGNNSAGGEAMVINLGKLVAHILGLILFTVLLSGLNLGIIALMAVGSLGSFSALRNAQEYEATHRDEVAEANKKRLYVHNQAGDYRNAKDIRLYNMSAWLDNLMDNIVDELMSLRRNNYKRYMIADSLDATIAFVRDAIAYTYLISLVLQGDITAGEFTMYFAAIAGVSTWLGQIATDMHLVLLASRDLTYLRSYLDMSDEPLATAQATDARHLAKPDAPLTIVFDNVSFRYPQSEQWILRDFNLTIGAGEKIALVGMNGAGKTTCIKLLTGLYRPTSGRILINGIDTATIERSELFALFSVVFQETRTLAMDVRRNVSVSPKEDSDDERVWESLNLAGLGDRVTELPLGIDHPLTRILNSEGVDLSGGQAQRLMLARALYKDAPIVVMDEPTAALDPLAEAELYQHYDSMVGGKTSLYISHRLASTRFCDRVAFISEGAVSELGSHDELMALDGAYAHMFSIQAYYYQKEIEKSKGEENND